MNPPVISAVGVRSPRLAVPVAIAAIGTFVTAVTARRWTRGKRRTAAPAPPGERALAVVAHELRTPLAAILYAATALGRVAGDVTAVRRAQQLIARQTRYATQLLDDLSDLTDGLEGAARLRLETVCLAEVVAAAVDTVHGAAAAREQCLTLTRPQTAVWLRCDPTRLTQMVVNLLTNAVKFTPPGGQVTVAVWHDGADAVLAVRDSGIGMTSDVSARVFDPFVRGPAGPGAVVDGLGLGLTIVRGIVTLHHGTVTVCSEGPGRGTEFLVRLPAARGEAATAPPAHAGGDRQRKPAA